MSEREFLQVFAERLRYYLDKYGMTQKELAERLGVGATSVYNWLNAIKSPRMDKVDQMCEIFHCRRSDLITEESEQYYYDPEASEIAEMLRTNSNFRVLFDAARDSSPEDLMMAAELLNRFKKTNPDA